MGRQKKVMIFAGIILLAVGIIALSFYFGNQEQEEWHRQGTAQREEQVEEPDTEITELTFFQEEFLDVFSKSFREEIKEKFSDEIELNGDPGTSCCVVLSNVEPLSGHTYQLFIQTNEAENNLYQVLANESEDMIDIELYKMDIPEIEKYGGVGYGDTIERIYIYHLD